MQPDEVTLCGLADDLAECLVSARSVSTIKKYSGYFKRFQTFMVTHNRSHLPARSIDVALLLTNLLSAKGSHSVISSICVYAI